MTYVNILTEMLIDFPESGPALRQDIEGERFQEVYILRSLQMLSVNNFCEFSLPKN